MVLSSKRGPAITQWAQETVKQEHGKRLRKASVPRRLDPVVTRGEKKAVSGIAQDREHSTARRQVPGGAEVSAWDLL